MKPSVYTRPNKPKYITVTKRRGAPEMALPEPAKPVEVDCFTECHVTPADNARQMVGYLGPVGDYLTLEPEAGTGNIIQALYEAGYSSNKLVAIERHTGLCNTIRARFKGAQSIDPINGCFIEYAEKAAGKIEYPRIIMNPPFRQVRAHMKAALSLLGRAGHSSAVLVALVPITFQHDEAETLENLPNDTFQAARVNTKIIRITR